MRGHLLNEYSINVKIYQYLQKLGRIWMKFTWIFVQKSVNVVTSISEDVFDQVCWAQCGKFFIFSITYILREINFGDSRSEKYAIFITFRHPEFWLLMIFYTFWRLEFTKLTKFSAPKNAKNGSFKTSRFSKIDFTLNLNDSKILKIPYCVELSLHVWILNFRWKQFVFLKMAIFG